MAILLISVAGCGDTQVRSGPNPPYASPEQSAPAAIASRGCEQVKAGQAPDGLATVKVMLLKPGTDLQRVSDDLGGKVPGGNTSVDAGIVGRDADAFYTWLTSSALCEPLRSQLLVKAKAFNDAGGALASAGPDVSGALQTAQSAYKDLSDFANNPPSA